MIPWNAFEAVTSTAIYTARQMKARKWPKSDRTLGWIIVGFAVVYVIGVAIFYFGSEYSNPSVPVTKVDRAGIVASAASLAAFFALIFKTAKEESFGKLGAVDAVGFGGTLLGSAPSVAFFLQRIIPN